MSHASVRAASRRIVVAGLTADAWRFMSRFYILVPFFTLAFFGGLIALVTWGW